LSTALIDLGTQQRPNGDGPIVTTVDREAVRPEFSKKYPAEGNAEQKKEATRKAFARAIKEAQSSKLSAFAMPATTHGFHGAGSGVKNMLARTEDLPTQHQCRQIIQPNAPITPATAPATNTNVFLHSARSWFGDIIDVLETWETAHHGE
jgi:hypothetical protein